MSATTQTTTTTLGAAEASRAVSLHWNAVKHDAQPRETAQHFQHVVEGGSVGLQIGGQAVDLVMLIMNQDGMRNLLSSKFKLGADASVAAGPVGRHASADTDWKLQAQVLSYSRARGAFAGLELSGAVIKQDKDSTREFYNRMVPFKTALTGTIDAPANAYPLLSTLAKWAKTASEK